MKEINGVRALLSSLDAKAKAIVSWLQERRLDSVPNRELPEMAVAETETLEALVQALGERITGVALPKPEIWEPSDGFITKHKKRKDTATEDQIEYFTWFQRWAAKTNAYLDYLEGHVDKRNESS